MYVHRTSREVRPDVEDVIIFGDLCIVHCAELMERDGGIGIY
jgi:hypothetical protein